jgi:hypothetical protein
MAHPLLLMGMMEAQRLAVAGGLVDPATLAHVVALYEGRRVAGHTLDYPAQSIATINGDGTTASFAWTAAGVLRTNDTVAVSGASAFDGSHLIAMSSTSAGTFPSDKVGGVAGGTMSLTSPARVIAFPNPASAGGSFGPPDPGAPAGARDGAYGASNSLSCLPGGAHAINLQLRGLDATTLASAGVMFYLVVREDSDINAGWCALKAVTGGSGIYVDYFRRQGRADISGDLAFTNNPDALGGGAWVLVQLHAVRTSATTYKVRTRVGSGAWAEGSEQTGDWSALATPCDFFLGGTFRAGVAAACGRDVALASLVLGGHEDDADIIAWVRDHPDYQAANGGAGVTVPTI